MDCTHIQVSKRHARLGPSFGLKIQNLNIVLNISTLYFNYEAEVPFQLWPYSPSLPYNEETSHDQMTWQREGNTTGTMKLLTSVETKVCLDDPGPSLCLRIQQIIAMKTADLRSWTGHESVTLSNMIPVCPHIEGRQPRSPKISGTLDYLIQRLLLLDDFWSSHFQYCYGCGMSWKLDVRSSNCGEECSIVSTRWLDFRSGDVQSNMGVELVGTNYFDSMSRFEYSDPKSPSDTGLYDQNISLLKGYES
ncbi:hypothetical protein N7456_000490 [Penicillium angulare]|uniref:Uncharacterized protein n=1 Tax=Penicillium angulare TaxID=116970 RepID=A0A9W9GC82_9EURO|nr:hypothetical protein N7456_000490 [Penicillium angulare]